VGQAVRGVFRDLVTILKSRDGLLAALICFLPIGTGAAQSVLAQAEVAAAWGAGEQEVGIVNGVMSGLISAIGCIVGGELCRRWHSRTVYAAVGAAMALVALLIAAAPRPPRPSSWAGLPTRR
jgi:predicted MFS family arabinose efflux permease